MSLVDAQQARRVVDRLVGYHLSPVLWKKIRRGLSAGRVQSVALRLIVEREKEIKAFIPEEYWEVYVQVKKNDEGFSVQLVSIGDKPFAAKKKEEVDPILVDLESSAYVVENVDASQRRRSSLAPFTTSTLQQAASNRLGFSSKKTMKLAQDLYEQGLITYHRTDSVNLSASALDRARTLIQKQFGDRYLPSQPRVFQTKSKNAQEAHEAIRPSNIESPTIETTAKLESDHERLYDLIYRRFLASQMTDALYDQTSITVAATPTGKTDKYLLRASGSVLIFDGWTKLFANKEDLVLPKVIQGDALEKEKVEAFQKFTQPKPRYNDASLVKTLEKLGIGRPSTYASIISVIELRGYVERENKAFVPTSIGTTVCDFLVANFPKEMDYAFTAGMEDDLDAIARGEKKWREVVRVFFNPFEKTVKDVTQEAARAQIPVEEMGQACPTCGEGKLVIRTGRFGKFVSCSRYPECTFTGKLIFKVEGLKCPECNEGEIRQRNSKRGVFFGCSRYPNCKWTSWQKPGGPENPIAMSYVPNPPKPASPEVASVKKTVAKKATKASKSKKKV
jgi:DNA topoisomerase-1